MRIGESLFLTKKILRKKRVRGYLEVMSGLVPVPLIGEGGSLSLVSAVRRLLTFKRGKFR